jgi:predicted protein tyrosine phosphatase
VFARDSRLVVRSAGVHASAARRVSAADSVWADAICAMERTHAAALRARFADALRAKALHVLEIPDDYAAMDPELIAMLRESLPALLGID